MIPHLSSTSQNFATAAIAAVALLTAFPSPAWAADVYFDTNGTTAGWGVYNGADGRETAGNWKSTDDATAATFNFATAGGTSTSTAYFTLESTSFTGSNQYITLGGGTLNIGGLVWRGNTVTARNNIGITFGTINFASGAILEVQDVQTGTSPDLTWQINSTVGDFTKTGAGSFKSQIGTFDGTVTITGGDFMTTVNRNLGANSRLVLNTNWINADPGAGATDTQTIGSLSGNGTLSSAGGGFPGPNSQRTLVISNGYGQNFAGSILDNSANLTFNVQKDGAGTQTLSGTLTYDGTTTVNAGTLLINTTHTTGSSYQVNSGGTLGGNGTIGLSSGNVTISNNGTLAPGTGVAPGTLTLNANLVLSGLDSKVAMEIAGTAPGTFDRVVGINVFTLDGDLTITLAGIYTTGTWDMFDFVSKSGNFDSIALTGTYTGTFTRSGDLWTGNAGLGDWTFDQATGVLNVVPEPSTVVMMIGGLGTVLLLRRRRR